MPFINVTPGGGGGGGGVGLYEAGASRWPGAWVGGIPGSSTGYGNTEVLFTEADAWNYDSNDPYISVSVAGRINLLRPGLWGAVVYTDYTHTVDSAFAAGDGMVALIEVKTMSQGRLAPPFRFSLVEPVYNQRKTTDSSSQFTFAVVEPNTETHLNLYYDRIGSGMNDATGTWSVGIDLMPLMTVPA